MSGRMESRDAPRPADPEGGAVLLTASGITKSFFGVRALDDVDLECVRGECHALVGENGAGKSTLMKILAGAHHADEGTIHLDGEPFAPRNPGQAREAGVSIIYQEFTLLPERTVADNIFLGREPRRGLLIDRRTMRARTDELLDTLGLGDHIAATDRVGDLSIAQQQMIEVSKALSFDAKLVIMDEPTAPLAAHEVELLHDRVRLLLDRGIAVLYVTHRLEEVFELSSRVTVLKDGSRVGTVATADVDERGLVEMMVGREVEHYYPERAGAEDLGRTVLSVSGGGVGMLHDIDLEVRAGEVVGLAGLQGAGRTELLQSIFGVTPFTTGSVELRGHAGAISSPRKAIAASVGFVPEDRKTEGLVLIHSVADNLLLPVRGVPGDGESGDTERDTLVGEVSRQVELRGAGADTEVQFASGGNQQKVVLGKWLARGVELLLLDEPTRGIDVGAKAGVHTVIRDLAREGMAIVMASSELPEVIGMSDRILVMRDGSIVGELPAGSSEAEIMTLATGGR